MTSKKKPIDLSIIIPAYREEDYIVGTLRQLKRYIQKEFKNERVEVIVVSADPLDGPNKTAALAEKEGKKFDDFTLVQPGPKVGKGRDLREGFAVASGSVQLFTDADLATPLHHIRPAYEQIKQGSDVVIAVRDLDSMHKTLSRKITSKIANFLTRTIAVREIPDTQCGFKAFTKKTAKSLFKDLRTLHWGVDIELLRKAQVRGLKIEQLPIDDWNDPKPKGLVSESQMMAQLKTLYELLRIRLSIREPIESPLIKLRRAVARRQNWVIFAAFLGLGLLTYAEFLPTHYSTDSYRFIEKPEDFVISTAVLGRLIATAFIQVWIWLGLNPVTDQIWLILGSIVAASAAGTLLYNKMIEQLKSVSFLQQVLTFMAVSLIVFNPFTASMFVFPENLFTTTMAMVTALIGGLYLARGKYAVGTVFAMSSTLLYQSWIYLLPAIAILFAKKISWRLVIGSGFVTGLALITNLIATRISNAVQGATLLDKRTSFSSESINENVRHIPTKLVDMLANHFEYMPRFSLFAFAVLAGLATVWVVYRRRDSLLDPMLRFVLIGSFLVLAPIAPTLVSASPLSSARVFMASGALAGMSALIYLRVAGRDIQWPIVAAAGALLVAVIVNVNLLGSQLQLVNKTDERELTELVNRIEQYEAETGTSVRRVVFINDAEPSCRIDRCYPGITSSVIDIDVPNPPRRAIEFYTGRVLNVLIRDQRTYRNWDAFNPEEHIIINKHTATFIRH